MQFLCAMNKVAGRCLNDLCASLFSNFSGMLIFPFENEQTQKIFRPKKLISCLPNDFERASCAICVWDFVTFNCIFDPVAGQQVFNRFRGIRKWNLFGRQGMARHVEISKKSQSEITEFWLSSQSTRLILLWLVELLKFAEIFFSSTSLKFAGMSLPWCWNSWRDVTNKQQNPQKKNWANETFTADSSQDLNYRSLGSNWTVNQAPTWFNWSR